MKVGDLVRYRQGSIINIAVAESGIKYHMIQMCGIETPRRWLEQDLEVLHEAR